MKVKGCVWAGLATDDFEGSLRFYTEVLGLPIETMGDGLAILTARPQQSSGFGRCWRNLIRRAAVTE